jgi:hypothetical protein
MIVIFIKILILGVTPEYFHLDIAGKPLIKAVDQTKEMIDFVWPGLKSDVYHLNWLNIESIQDEFDIILCDGGMHLLNYPNQQLDLSKVIKNKLSKDGVFLARLFVPPLNKESLDNVFEDLNGLNIPSMNHLKIRLCNALQNNAKEGVSLNDVWLALNSYESSEEVLAQKLRCNILDVQAVNAYKDSKVRYHFSSLDEFVNLCAGLRRDHFHLSEIFIPDYFMGNQFPSIALTKI